MHDHSFDILILSLMHMKSDLQINDIHVPSRRLQYQQNLQKRLSAQEFTDHDSVRCMSGTAFSLPPPPPHVAQETAEKPAPLENCGLSWISPTQVSVAAFVVAVGRIPAPFETGGAGHL